MTRADKSPLRPLVFAILLVLNEGDQHGYGIMRTVNERMRRNAVLGPGTLYRTLKELREAGLIEHVPAPAGADPRRQYYGISGNGRRAAHDEARRMAGLVDIARAGRLLQPEPGE